MIDPHIWEDPGFNGLSLQARLLFIGMVSNADDEGYLRGDAGSLKRLIFGFDDSITKADVENWIQEITLIPNIHFYTVGNETFTHFTKWDTYQKQQKDRIQASTYPSCNRCVAGAKQVLTEVSKEVGQVKKSEEKGSEEGKNNSPSPEGSGAKKDFRSLKQYAAGIALFFVLALPSSAATLETRYIITTVRSTKQAPVKRAPTPGVFKEAGQSAKIESRTGASLPENETEIINSMRYPDVIRQIYQGESTSGRNDVCRSRGIGFNGFGYGESGTRLRTLGPLCFPTFRDVVQNVDDWIADKVAQGYSLNKLNCLYVRGYAVENCSTAYKLK